MSTVFAPSAAQLEQLDRQRPGPVVLFYQYDLQVPAEGDALAPRLANLAAAQGGTLRWAGPEEQVLIGRVPAFGRGLFLAFHDSATAGRFVRTAEHAATLGLASAAQVALLSDQPKALARVTRLLALVAPRLPLSHRIDPSPEPGLGTSSVMPTAEAVAALRSHPRQHTPVVMINWLKF